MHTKLFVAVGLLLPVLGLAVPIRSNDAPVLSLAERDDASPDAFFPPSYKTDETASPDAMFAPSYAKDENVAREDDVSGRFFADSYEEDEKRTDASPDAMFTPSYMTDETASPDAMFAPSYAKHENTAREDDASGRFFVESYEKDEKRADASPDGMFANNYKTDENASPDAMFGPSYVKDSA